MIHVYMDHKRYRKEGWPDRYTDFATEWKNGASNRFGLAKNVNEMRRKRVETPGMRCKGFENKRCEKALHRSDGH